MLEHRDRLTRGTGLLLGLTSTLLLTACGSSVPSNIGLNNNQLAPCPDSPNCVSSLSHLPEQAIEPLTASLDQISALLITLDEAQIILSSPTYLHAEFTSSLFRFVDDVEFLWDDQRQVTQVRSASRIGYSDLGANRDRIERLRLLLEP